MMRLVLGLLNHDISRLRNYFILGSCDHSITKNTKIFWILKTINLFKIIII